MNEPGRGEVWLVDLGLGVLSPQQLASVEIALRRWLAL